MLVDYNTDQMTSNHQQNGMLNAACAGAGSGSASLYPPSHQQQQAAMGAMTDSPYFYQNSDQMLPASRQTFSFNAATAPLAALHSMTEAKTSQPQHTVTSSYNPAAYYSMKNSMLNAAATPHGISDILSRTELQAQLQARLGQGMYYNSCSQAVAGVSANLSPTTKEFGAGGGHASAGGNSGIYWPSNSQLVSNSPTPPNWHHKHGGMMSLVDMKDKKKKNTRPTFSGSQIFALEKTFEQQKYLAGPERGRLAYALGMSESQVKVWFQNRRTKWRKKHAAEMASTKRRAATGGGNNSGSGSGSTCLADVNTQQLYDPLNSPDNSTDEPLTTYQTSGNNCSGSSMSQQGPRANLHL